MRLHKGDAAAPRQSLDCLHSGGVIPAEKIARPRLTPIEQSPQAFGQYLLNNRALVRATVINYVSFIRGLLTDRFGSGPVRLSRLRARDVMRFVQRQAPRLHLKRAKLLTTALRSFLRYARYRGAVTQDVAAAVPTVANWSMSSIPRAIPADAVRQLLASIKSPNRDRASRLRDPRSCWLVWDCGRAKWRVLSWTIWTGKLARSRSEGNAGCETRSRYPQRSARPSPGTSGADARAARAAACSCGRALTSAVVRRQCHCQRRATRHRGGGHQRTDQGCASIPARVGDADVAPRGHSD